MGQAPFDVLIVEDDLALLAFLVTRLEYELDLRVAGYATDAEEGMRLSEELRPDIVLTDFDLPDTDGLTMLDRLRAVLPDSALVLYTGAWTHDLERAARLNGADDCLDKTVAPSQLIAALRSSVAERRGEPVTQPSSSAV
jgi:two-component system response regulator YesN